MRERRQWEGSSEEERIAYNAMCEKYRHLFIFWLHVPFNFAFEIILSKGLSLFVCKYKYKKLFLKVQQVLENKFV